MQAKTAPTIPNAACSPAKTQEQLSDWKIRLNQLAGKNRWKIYLGWVKEVWERLAAAIRQLIDELGPSLNAYLKSIGKG